MSYHVVIADDEYFILQRIKKIIPWEELNLTLIYEAQNGIEVLNLLQKHSVDILLLDIKMPQMNGLEVAEYVHNYYPLVKVIILSGYNDFSYAQVAIKYGVIDYLLKPVESSSLNTTLNECIKKIQIQRNNQLQIQQYYHYERCKLLTSILSGSLPPQDIYVKYPELMQYPYTLYICLFVNDETTCAINSMISALRMQNFDCEYMKEMDYIYTIQVFLKHKDCSIITDILKDSMETEEAFYHFILIGETLPITDCWKNHHKKLFHQLDYRFFSSQSRIYQPINLPKQHITAFDLTKVRQSIIYFLNSKDSNGLHDFVDNLFHEILKLCDPGYLHLIVEEFLMTYKISHYDINKLNTITMPSVDMILEEIYLLSDIKDCIMDFGLQIMSKTEMIPSDIVLSKKLSSYILAHYSDANLSVAQLAKVFHLNSCYMGSIFKRVNNQSILQYITQVRMELSKTLIESNTYKISEIANMVGYSDAFYYSKSFKKLYGYSPKDYCLQKSHLSP